MSRSRTILGIVLLSSAIPAAAQDDLPVNIRVIVECIEVSHELVTEVMVSEHADSDPKLHARIRALVKKKKARIMETTILTTRPRQKARVESIMEHIYPVEFEPLRWIGCGGSGKRPPRDPSLPPRVRPTDLTAFDTQNVGVMLDIEPVLDIDKKLLELRFKQEIVGVLRYETWFEYHDQWGDASVRCPIYDSLATETVITLRDGSYGFIGLHTPKNRDGSPATTRKIMLFVRADIVPIGP